MFLLWSLLAVMSLSTIFWAERGSTQPYVHYVLKTSSTVFFIVFLSLLQVSSQFMSVLFCTAKLVLPAKIYSIFPYAQTVIKITRWQQCHFWAPVALNSWSQPVLWGAPCSQLPALQGMQGQLYLPRKYLPLLQQEICVLHLVPTQRLGFNG